MLHNHLLRLICLFVLFPVMGTTAILAAELQFTSSTLEREKIATPAINTIKTTVPSGLVATDYIEIDLGVNFDISSILASDIEVQDDGIVLVSGSDWTMTKGVGLITITFLGGTNPVPAAFSEITILIGDDAGNKIINPGTPGSYPVYLTTKDSGGGVKDSGVAVVPILSDDQTRVTAIVLPSGPTNNDPRTRVGSKRRFGPTTLCTSVETCGVDTAVVYLDGYSHPGGMVDIYANDVLIGTTTSNQDGYFWESINTSVYGPVNFIFKARDEGGLSNPDFPFSTIFTPSTILAAHNLFLAPTISYTHSDQPGNFGYISGKTIPYATVLLRDKNNGREHTVVANSSGEYILSYDFGAGTHTFDAIATWSGLTSSVSFPVSFTVGESCDPYLLQYIKEGKINDNNEVKKLEDFLNKYEGESLVVNGVYEKADVDAVNRFQKKYEIEVLGPWGISSPTGYVYQTTVKQINQIYCNQDIEIEATCPYFTEYHKRGDQGGDVQRIQNFLNASFDAGLVENGIYNWDTFQAVKKYQIANKGLILDPWGLKEPTGWWYQSSRHTANFLVNCPEGEKELDNKERINYK